jgi:aarF domain-containing kinase
VLLLLHSSFTPFGLPHMVLDQNFSGLLRSIVGNLGVSRRVRLLTYAKCAVHGLEKQSEMESGK